MQEPDRIAQPWGERTPYGRDERWPVRVDQHLAVVDGRIVGVRGCADDRVNHGRLGPKDLFGWQANASPDRLTRPLVRIGGRLVETDRDTAMGGVVAEAKRLPE